MALGLILGLRFFRCTLARAYCLRGPVLTIEIQGDYSRLTQSERETVERIVSELAKLR